MGGICPHCEKKIELLECYQQTESKFIVTAKDNKIEYDEEPEYYNTFSSEWGYACCPECGETIEEITSEEEAIEFLSGKPKKSEKE